MRPTNRICLACGLLLCAPLYAATAFAEAWNQDAKLTAGDGAAWDWFGYAVAIFGDTALIGAGWDDDWGQDSGSAYVFRRDAYGVWSQRAKLLANDGSPGDRFAISAALSGDTALLGAKWDNADGGEDCGSAYVFREIGGLWTRIAKLVASDGAVLDEFGNAVAVDAGTALIGAHYANAPLMDSGAAYVFREIDGEWTEIAKLTASDGAAVDFFGYSVALSGDTALIGARYDDDRGLNSGSAYVFREIGGAWTQTAKLLAADGAQGDLFGCAVALSGDTALVGAAWDDNPGADSGSVYVFQRAGAAWTQVAKLTAGDGAAGDYFGYSIGLSTDTAVIGAINHAGTGATYVFRRISGVWTQVATLYAGDAAPGDWFGFSVALSGQTALVGAHLDDDRGLNSGSAYVFARGTYPGDLNCDGVINFDDINPFVLALSDPAAYQAAYPDCNWLNADCNLDGQVDFDDINAFVALLSG